MELIRAISKEDIVIPQEQNSIREIISRYKIDSDSIFTLDRNTIDEVLFNSGENIIRNCDNEDIIVNWERNGDIILIKKTDDPDMYILFYMIINENLYSYNFEKPYRVFHIKKTV